MTENTQTSSPSQTNSMDAAPAPIPAAHFFRTVEKWDGLRTASIPQETIEDVIGLHRLFARHLVRSLGVYLRAVVQIEATGGVQVSYPEVESTLTGATLVIAMRPESHILPVLVMADPKVAAPCLDLLLGGSGEKPLDRTELTDVDVQILAELSRLIARDLQATWQDLGLRLHSEVSLGKAARRIIPAAGKALRIDFSVKLGESAGGLSLLLGIPLVETMLQALHFPAKPQEDVAPAAIGKEYADALCAVSVPVELVLPPMSVSIGDLMRLAPSQVLTLPLRAGHPAHIVVAGREIFSAAPVRSGRWRAAKIEHAIVNPENSHERPEAQ